MKVDATTAQMAVQIFAFIFFAGAAAMTVYWLLANKKDNKRPDALPGAEKFAPVEAAPVMPEPDLPVQPRFSFEDAAAPESPAPAPPPPPPSTSLPFPSRRAIRNAGNQDKTVPNQDASIFGAGEVDDWG